VRRMWAGCISRKHCPIARPPTRSAARRDFTAASRES
jgi:hypothetical protein